MKLLILGGTQFIGRHLTQLALQRGHDVTLFNRGHTAFDLFPQATVVTGDRYADLGALEHGSWDAVIDTCGYTPQSVMRSAEVLREHVDHYTFVSTGSVYASFADPPITEDHPVGTISDDEAAAAEEIPRPVGGASASTYGRLYGPLKARSERAVERLFPEHALIVRPGIVIGPFDYSDRFTYWVRRFSRAGDSWGNTVLAPGRPEQSIQLIDVMDLAAWLLDATLERKSGVFNATGPGGTLGGLLNTCQRVLNPQTSLAWVENSFLLEREIEPMQLTPWLPSEAIPDFRGFFSISNGRAVAEGLSFQPVEDTVLAIQTWDETRNTPLHSGLTPEREKELLTEWSHWSGRIIS
jgi:2'-hydroxyisoflavone reductase